MKVSRFLLLLNLILFNKSYTIDDQEKRTIECEIENYIVIFELDFKKTDTIANLFEIINQKFDGNMNAKALVLKDRNGNEENLILKQTVEESGLWGKAQSFIREDHSQYKHPPYRLRITTKIKDLKVNCPGWSFTIPILACHSIMNLLYDIREKLTTLTGHTFSAFNLKLSHRGRIIDKNYNWSKFVYKEGIWEDPEVDLSI